LYFPFWAVANYADPDGRVGITLPKPDQHPETGDPDPKQGSKMYLTIFLHKNVYNF
jgi:hypothetical protein